MSSSAEICVRRFPSRIPDRLRRGTATLGSFDGIHVGHRHVIGRAKEISDGPLIVVSFYPHPRAVLGKGEVPRPITTLREKIRILASLGVDLLYLVHFTPETASMSAREFVDRVLFEGLGLSGLLVGPDAAFGRSREGNIDFMTRELPKLGVAFSVVSEFEVAGERPSSREIRDLLGRGELPRAAAMLGRPFSISARVGHGDGRGRQLGFPTANLICGDRLLPRYGVYACWASFAGKRFGAVCNIGVRPTFDGLAERVEVHLLDMPFESLYGRRLEVEFVGRVRDEKKFSSAVELVAQIADDVSRARELLA